MENSERDENTKRPYLPPEKPICSSGRNRTRHGTMDCFQIVKGVCQGCIFSTCLFNFYAEYIMQNHMLDEAELESRLPVEISIPSDMQMTDTTLWQQVKWN